MKLKDILAISDEPGLFRFVAQGKNAIIVEHLETGKRKAAYATAKVHSLDEISVYTENKEVPLGEVLDKIFEKENGETGPDPKSDPDFLRTWFTEVLPDYDPDRVYNSDIRKIVTWYNFLLSHKLIEMEEDETGNDVAEEKSEPLKTKAKKNTTTKKDN